MQAQLAWGWDYDHAVTECVGSQRTGDVGGAGSRELDKLCRWRRAGRDERHGTVKADGRMIVGETVGNGKRRLNTEFRVLRGCEDERLEMDGIELQTC